MTSLIHRINPKHLLAFLGICLLVFSMALPSVLTNFYIYAGMLIGYFQAKTQLLSLFGSNLGEWIVSSYLSVRYKFGLSSTSHDGMIILLANTLYFSIATTVLYTLLQRYEKIHKSKRIMISALSSGILMIVVGVTVLAFNSKAPFQLQSNEPIVEYVVQKGDTCQKIAFDYGVSIESIVEYNGLRETCLIFVGQPLVIPLQ